MPKKGMTIFISYVEEDKEMAEKLYKDIKNHGYQPWIESKDLLAGQKKDLEKQKALKQADFCLVLLSKTSISKPGDAQKEQTTALGLLDQFPESDNYLIPVRLNDCELPMRLSNLNAVDMFYDYEDGLNRLLKSFKQKQQAIQLKDSNHLFLQNNTMDSKPADKVYIYISNSYIDNDNHWIDNFATYIKNEITKRLGGSEGFSIFWDKDASSDDSELPEKIIQEIELADILVTIVSPGYMNSKKCKRERHTFFRAKQNSYDKKLIYIEREQVEKTKLPIEIKKERPIRFWTLNQNEQFPKILGDTDQGPAYHDKINTISHEMANTIKTIAKQHITENVVRPNEVKDNLFDHGSPLVSPVQQTINDFPQIKKTKKCAIEIKTNCSADIFLKHISDNSRVKAIGTTKKNSLLSKYILTSEQDPGKYEIIASAKNTEKSIKIILSPMKNSETIVFHFDINLKYLVILVIILFGLIVNNVYKYGIFFSDQNKTKNMILIPEGSFLKGGEDDKNLPLLRLIRRYRDQPDIVKKLANIKPQKIFLPTYYIDINEVTNFDYEKFLSDKNANKFNHNEQPSTKKNHIPEYWDDPQFNKPDQPVVGVDWYDAYSYCMWKGKQLQSRVQWQKAARGNDNRLYPWGNEYDQTRCNDNLSPFYNSVAVGSYSAGTSPYGVNDLVGNVEEWTNSKNINNPGYYDITGCSWKNECKIYGLIINNFVSSSPNIRDKYTGFRCTGNYYQSNMVIIPAGTFNSGGENSVTINIIREYKLFGETISKLVAEQPVLIDLDAYYIDKKEVTNAEYNTFLENVILHQRKVKKHFHPDAPKNKNYKPEFVNEQELNDPEQPVVGIDWFDAYAFCSWNGKRLPTEDEWKKAAKGKDNYLYPWGNTFESSYFQQSMDKPAKVISNKRDCSTYGLFDMASNVSEWTESIDVYGKNIICGTSYEKNDLLRVYSLIFMDTRQNKEYRSKTTGFRCALSIPK